MLSPWFPFFFSVGCSGLRLLLKFVSSSQCEPFWQGCCDPNSVNLCPSWADISNFFPTGTLPYPTPFNWYKKWNVERWLCFWDFWSLPFFVWVNIGYCNTVGRWHTHNGIHVCSRRLGPKRNGTMWRNGELMRHQLKPKQQHFLHINHITIPPT